ncbi:MAG: FHA domain-containing protein [Planctomycetes bacterium]|nr:FHA domain-containing protein [Planctomycetota bacterium]
MPEDEKTKDEWLAPVTMRVKRPTRGRVAPKLPVPLSTPEDPSGAVAWAHCPPMSPVPISPAAPLIRIGRTGGQIVLPHKEVSRRHAAIRLDGDQLLLEDLGSANGTYLNHLLLRAPATVYPGDEISIGPYTLNLEPAEMVDDSRETTAISTVLSGDLSQVPLDEMYRDLEFNQRTGVLEVRSKRLHGRLDVAEGVPCAAAFEDLTGVEALTAMLWLKTGRFLFTPGRQADKPPLPVSLTAALLDWARAVDEKSG